MMLQLRGRVSASALAREFEVSVRTIYRDMDELSAAGVPVYAEPGRSGGFALHAGFRTRLTGLTAREAAALAFIGAPMAAEVLGSGSDARAARLKLLAGLSESSAREAERVAARFHIDPVPWYQARPPPPFLAVVADAVWRERQIRMDYESWKETVRRTLSPLGLVLKAGDWYLAGAIGNGVRTYRVEAIKSLTVLDRDAARPRGFNLAGHWVRSAAAFEKRLQSIEITIRVSQEGRRLLAERAPSLPAMLTRADAHEDFWEGTIPWEPAPQGVRDVLRFAGELEVLAPRNFRLAVAGAGTRMAAAHND